MFRLLGPLAVLAGLILAPPLVAQETGPAEPAYLNLKVPADAEVRIGNQLTTKTGTLGQFVTPPLADQQQEDQLLHRQGHLHRERTASRSLSKRKWSGGAWQDHAVDLTTPKQSDKPETPTPSSIVPGQARTRFRPGIAKPGGSYSGYYDRYYDPTYRPAVGGSIGSKGTPAETALTSAGTTRRTRTTAFTTTTAPRET